MRMVAAVAFVAGAVTLAVLIGQRMSTDAMAVVIGVVVGVAASIPTSLLVVVATRGSRESARPVAAPRPPASMPSPPPPTPQIIVVSPPVSQAGYSTEPWRTGSSALPQLPPPQDPFFVADTRRRYKVVGEDEHWLDGSD